eukprot:7032901-Pyramimonas_sp.AAC.1
MSRRNLGVATGYGRLVRAVSTRGRPEHGSRLNAAKGSCDRSRVNDPRGVRNQRPRQRDVNLQYSPRSTIY